MLPNTNTNIFHKIMANFLGNLFPEDVNTVSKSRHLFLSSLSHHVFSFIYILNSKRKNSGTEIFEALIKYSFRKIL